MFRILVTASRSWVDYELIYSILDEYASQHPQVSLVSGNCPEGGDKFCEDYAETLCWVVERHPADWAKYGKRAGYVRNAEMVTLGADVCLAFISNNSKGASKTKNLAIKAGIETRVFRDN